MICFNVFGLPNTNQLEGKRIKLQLLHAQVHQSKNITARELIDKRYKSAGIPSLSHLPDISPPKINTHSTERKIS